MGLLAFRCWLITEAAASPIDLEAQIQLAAGEAIADRRGEAVHRLDCALHQLRLSRVCRRGEFIKLSVD